MIRQIDIARNHYQIEFHGNMNSGFISADSQGILILKIKNSLHEVEIFNSVSDGYNGVADTAAGIKHDSQKNLTRLDETITKLILKFSYSIEDYEYEVLRKELDLKSKEDLGNLFGNIEIYGEKNGIVSLLTSIETQ